MYYGTIARWNSKKNFGIIEVVKDGFVEKYFLLSSHVARSPQVIEEGQHVRFEIALPPPRLGLLPVARAVEVSSVRFADHGVAALQAGLASQTDSDQTAPQSEPGAGIAGTPSQNGGGQ